MALQDYFKKESGISVPSTTLGCIVMRKNQMDDCCVLWTAD